MKTVKGKMPPKWLLEVVLFDMAIGALYVVGMMVTEAFDLRSRPIPGLDGSLYRE